MVQDSLSDLFTRLRNAVRVRKPFVVIPFSRMKWGLLKILKDTGYIESFEKIILPLLPQKNKKVKRGLIEQIMVVLQYAEGGESALHSLRYVSKPGRRVYVKQGKVPVVLNHLGIALLSTSRGLMTDQEARKQKVGGEIIAEIY